MQFVYRSGCSISSDWDLAWTVKFWRTCHGPLYVSRSPFEIWLGLDRTMCIQCIHGIFRREIVKYMVKYGVFIRFWPTLCITRWDPFSTSCNTCLIFKGTNNLPSKSCKKMRELDHRVQHACACRVCLQCTWHKIIHSFHIPVRKIHLPIFPFFPPPPHPHPTPT